MTHNKYIRELKWEVLRITSDRARLRTLNYILTTILAILTVWVVVR